MFCPQLTFQDKQTVLDVGCVLGGRTVYYAKQGAEKGRQSSCRSDALFFPLGRGCPALDSGTLDSISFTQRCIMSRVIHA